MQQDLVAASTVQFHLDEAIDRARERLLSRQGADDHWCGELEGDTILETEYALLLQFLGRGSDERCRRAAASVRARQLPEGGWAIYPGGPPEVSASVKAYFVLKLAGDLATAPHMESARRTILSLGGAGAANSFTKIFLALLGQGAWEDCPAVPPELVLLPRWAYFNLYEMSSWSRAIIVPLSIVWAKRPVRPVPESAAIRELYAEGSATKRRSAKRTARAGLWRAFFGGLDRTLKLVEQRRGFDAVRPRALERASAWMLEHLEESDGLGAIFPSIVYSVLALVALGYSEDHPQVLRQLRELEKLELEETGGGLRVQPCRPPVWDSALAVHALCASGMPPKDERLTRAARWILSKEVRKAGDWRVHNTVGPVGGWYFEFANEFYPDCDDTAQVLTSLSMLSLPDADRVRWEGARRRALDWLLSMQNDDGGWAAFDRGCTNEVLSFIPFADHNAMLDPSCPDITGRVLDCLMRQGLGRNDEAVRRGVEFLRRSQETDGAWYGRWGCNYLYGTWLALSGLSVAGGELHDAARIQNGARWLRDRQNADGGWGETFRSYEDPGAKGLGPSTAAQTSWALLGLWASGDRGSSELARGVDYLLATRGDDGTWHDRWWTGTGFPRVFYLRYDLYDDYFPLLALSTIRQRAKAG